MAVSRREFVLGALAASLASLAMVVLALASDSWVRCTARDDALSSDSYFRYGLFRGELQLNNLATPTYNTLYMTCVLESGACAVSCKTTREARRDEVRALAERREPGPACAAATTASDTPTLEEPAVISSALYIAQVTLVSGQLAAAAVSAGLHLLNVLSSPTEPALGLPGCQWSSVVAGCLGIASLFTFGVYWAASSLQTHLAFSYIAIGLFTPYASLGYSYWVILVSVLCSGSSAGLLAVRRALLERDPPPPTIAVQTQSDNTVFLY